MKIRVEKIPVEGLSLEFVEDVEAFPVLAEIHRTGEVGFQGPVSIRLAVGWVRDMVEVKGIVETTVRLRCGRCLARFTAPLRQRVSLYFTRTLPELDAPATEDGVEVSADVIGLVPFEGDEIDLTEVIQEQVTVALPPWPLCGEECQGLCPVCGADRNRTACGCERQDFDNPFAVLKNLKLK